MEPRNAIITGASHGIGKYIAEALASRGMNLLLVARSEPELARLAMELRSRDRKVAIAPVDLAHPQAAQRIATAANAELGGVDVLVNNAAIELQRRFDMLETDEIEAVIRVDLIAPIELSHQLLPGMLDRRYGRIINISSIAGHVGFPNTEAYAASKDGLIAFSRVLRNDYRRGGVSASAIILGAVKDAGLGQRTLDELDAKTNTAFMVGPEKVARAVLRAIDKDKAEIVVMPGPGRLMKALMDLFPGFGPAMTRMSGGDKFMATVADYREAQHATFEEGRRPDVETCRTAQQTDWAYVAIGRTYRGQTRKSFRRTGRSRPGRARAAVAIIVAIGFWADLSLHGRRRRRRRIRLLLLVSLLRARLPALLLHRASSYRNVE